MRLEITLLFYLKCSYSVLFHASPIEMYVFLKSLWHIIFIYMSYPTVCFHCESGEFASDFTDSLKRNEFVQLRGFMTHCLQVKLFAFKAFVDGRNGYE